MTESLVYWNGQFLAESRARVPLMTHALQYGTGVFEGIRGYHDTSTGDVHLFRPLDHFRRMLHNVSFLNIRLAFTAEELTALAVELIRRNDLHADVYVRPLAYKSSTRVGVTLPSEDGFAMIAVPMGDYLDTHAGLHCCVSSWRRLQDNAIPCRAKICGAYVNSALAAQDARDRGFDEAILLNEAGHVAEGSAMNLFLVRDGGLVTPDASSGILEGVTRDTVMALGCETMGVHTAARRVERSELCVADEVFLCGTAAQIAPVTRIDGRAVGTGAPGPITQELRATYARVVRGRVPRYAFWLEPVYGSETAEAKVPKRGAA